MKGQKSCRALAVRPLKKLFLLAAAIGIAAARAQSATLTVTTTADGVTGSLRKAIADAAAGDTIVFQIPASDGGYNPLTGNWTILLTGATAANKTFVIDKNLTIDGSSQDIVVRRDPAAPADFRIFEVPGGQTVTLRQLWISNGNVTAATGDTLNRWGAGIRSFGTLTVDQCRFTGNAGESGGALVNFGGKLTVSRSTFSGNSVSAYGGAIHTSSLNLNVIERCTFNQNNAAQGGAIFNNQGFAAIRSCTIVGNAASMPIVTGSLGGGIFAINGAQGQTQMENTIVVGNTSAGTAPDIAGSINSSGHNLLGSTDNTGGLFGPGDQNGVTLGQVNLDALNDNGGFTPTMRPKPGSFAIDKGRLTNDANGQPANVDQRGAARPADRPESNAPSGDGSDIGAVELGAPQTGPTFTVNSTAERTNGECTTHDCTTLDALALANAVADLNTINFKLPPPPAGSFTNIETATLTPNGLPITAPLTINGASATRLRMRAGLTSGRIFNVSSTNVTISGLLIGGASSPNQNGGCILNTGGLTLNDCYVVDGTASGSGLGGGIYNSSAATLVLNRCTFWLNNAGQFGGAVYSEGTLMATNCTFSENKALRGGGVISRGGGTTKIRNCTFTLNQATDGVAMPGFGGGGLFCEGSAPQHFIGNTILAGNTATNDPDIRGNYTSEGHNLIGIVGDAVGFSNNVRGDQVGTTGAPKDARLSALNPAAPGTPTHALLSDSPAINAGDDALAPPTDQRGYGRNGVSDIGAFEFGGVPLSILANISTRLRVQNGENVLIGGMIATGTAGKKVIVRAIGPTLTDFGLPGALSDPTLELFQGNALVASNNDWRSSPQQAEIQSSGLAPTKDAESAIIATLTPNQNYTAIVRGNNGEAGIGVVEAFDLDQAVAAKLGNISTRGFVDVDDSVMIAGVIVGPAGGGTVRVLVRALGPTLGDFGVQGFLADPTVDLVNSSGTVIRSNDSWQSDPSQSALIQGAGLAPTYGQEAALVETLLPGAYTAVVRGAARTTGVGLVEVYHIP